jgi:hypothetical protein
MSTRRDVSSDRKTGSTRRGLDAMFNSSRLAQVARQGGSAPRKLADMSRARRVVEMEGIVFVRNEGIAFGVVDDPIRRCVVPANK